MTTQVTFTVTQPSSLHWIYETNYWFETQASSGGSVSVDKAGYSAQTAGSWVPSGTNVVLVATPDEHWHFTGWTESGTGNQLSSNARQQFVVNNPLHVRANFAVDTFMVNFDLGEYGTKDSGTLSQSVAYGMSAVAPSVKANVGYRFVGWDKTFSSITANATITAQYEPIAYTLTYTDVQGCANSNPTTYTIEDAVSFTALNGRVGWRFLGWNPSGIALGTTGDKTVQATWAANAYTVSFDANGGTGSMAALPMTYDTESEITSNAFVRTGYVFVGWSTSENGAVEYQNGVAVSNLTSKLDGEVTLYAVWEKIVVSTPEISVGMDAFSSESTLVTINCATDGAMVYYTTDGSTPTAESAVYVGVIEIGSRGAKTIKALAVVTDDVCSEVATLEISAPHAPTVSPTDGTIITSSASVNIASDNPNATIYCTTDGTEPTLASPVYSRFKASKKMTVKAMAVVDGMAWSETTTARYALGQCADPSISSGGGTTFSSSNYQVSISKNGDKGVLRYTTDGSEPTEESAIYTAPIAISETTTIKAKVFDDDYFDSAVASATFVRQWNTVATPVIEAPKTFSGTKCSVVLTCETVGAVIRYTTDGSEPNSHSAKYVGPFDITSTTVVKAIALKTDCKSSDVATKTITKEWGIGDALNDPDRTFTGGSDEDWVRDTVVSHDGVESMRSGPLGNSATTGLFAESSISTVVNGRGTVTFWWKASCEEDDDYEWDHGEFRVDNVVVSRINGASAWTDVSCEITSAGAHTLTWVYCKDDFGKDHDDCLWLDQFGWKVDDPIPDIGDTPSAAAVAAAIAGATDPLIATKIDEKNYNDFRDWACKVKTAGGGDAGAPGVMNADHAWISYALGQGTLLSVAPTDANLSVEAFEPTAEAGKFDFTVSVGTIQVGSEAAKENLKKVFGIEGAATLESAAFSSDKVDIEFGTPVDGKVKFTAGPKDASSGAFFMKVKMLP